MKKKNGHDISLSDRNYSFPADYIHTQDIVNDLYD